jgi:hypothetical protein
MPETLMRARELVQKSLEERDHHNITSISFLLYKIMKAG